MSRSAMSLINYLQNTQKISTIPGAEQGLHGEGEKFRAAAGTVKTIIFVINKISGEWG